MEIEEPKKKPRARKPKKEPINNAADSLLNALKFILPAQKKIGTPQMQHCAISGGWIVASNGILTIAAKIEEDLNARPNTYQFIDALSKCGQELNISQLSEHSLSVKSENFKALVECASLSELSFFGPDENIAQIDNRVKDALAAVACLATEGASNAALAGVLLQANSAVATNGCALLEYWHGTNLPPDLLMPKSAAVAVSKCGKNLTGFGYSQTSVTFWFEDGSFIKTQLYGERFPNYAPLLNVESNPWALPDEFLKAIHAVESFSKDSIVYFEDGFILSNNSDNATSYCIEGLPSGMAFSSKYILELKHAMQKADFNKDANKMYFFAENMRGVLMGVEILKQHPSHPDFEDSIPF